MVELHIRYTLKTNSKSVVFSDESIEVEIPPQLLGLAKKIITDFVHTDVTIEVSVSTYFTKEEIQQFEEVKQ